MKAHICKPQIVQDDAKLKLSAGALYIGEPCEDNLFAVTSGDIKVTITSFPEIKKRKKNNERK